MVSQSVACAIKTENVMGNETKQIGARIRVDVIDRLRELSKRKRISMAVLTEQAIVKMLKEDEAATDG